MPYIKQNERQLYDPLIKEIIEKLFNHSYGENEKDYSEGELNYIFSSVVWKLFDVKRSYQSGNKLIGVLENVKLEFYRKKLGNYEDVKENENGSL